MKFTFLTPLAIVFFFILSINTEIQFLTAVVGFLVTNNIEYNYSNIEFS